MASEPSQAERRHIVVTPRRRKNIDDLTIDELANYLHALERLFAISAADPESIDGYTYFEQLHDGDKGPCEHANDTFLPWHRAQLYLFEEALRRSDPPQTSNVTVPYWDWSALPSGKRYPKRFEDEKSLLFHKGRQTKPICVESGGGGECFRLPFPRHYLEQSVLSVSVWSSPPPAGSNSTPDPSFGGVAGGESKCQSPFGLGFGALEEPAHNAMHGRYIAGDMGDTSSAALDPIFWSFHSYIDLLWWQWHQIARNKESTGLESRLCGLFKDREHKPENRFQVKDVLDPESQLQYTYDYTRRDVPVPPPVPGQLFATHPALDFALSGRKDPEIVRSLDVTVPAPGFARARLNFTGVQVMTPFSYDAEIYLVPADEAFRPREASFRERYFVGYLYIWKHHHGAHGEHGDPNAPPRMHNIAVDVTRALAELARSGDGRRWKVWIALAADTEPHAPVNVLEAATATDAATSMDFRDVTLAVE
jgi:tyrosinase